MAQEREFMGARKAKVWTYLILMAVLLLGAIIANAAFSNPALAKDGVKSFLGLPGWALAVITFVIGSGVYWFGLKVETDWPEAIGAFLISAAVAAGEFMIGWRHFEFGIVVLPYVLPILVFVILLMFGMRRSA
ncbi:MAG: hypothetical protein KBG28_14075 [Kofleriaceae bacterium]|nr:hypothetical protein [Kofleriaceae bacterium]MBP6838482.1 hypothetical protein [Kofleriaceae bacterium]MBP9205092.1 hypothetical protein [Kofleriaceae bacterium]